MVTDFEALRAPARSLGAAFQKVNFLRDLSDDYQDLGRSYFPGVNVGEFSDALASDQQMQVFFFSPYFSSAEKKEGLAKTIDWFGPLLRGKTVMPPRLMLKSW